MTKPQLGAAVEVTWEDAWQAESYLSQVEAAQCQPQTLQSQGFLLRSDSRAVMIGMDKIGDGRYRDIKFIPRGMVVKVRQLR